MYATISFAGGANQLLTDYLLPIHLPFCKSTLMANNTSPHILGTASNLLGFCLVVLTSLHFTNIAATTLIDEATLIIALLLLASAILSFVSIRTPNPRKEVQFEKIADYLFICSLTGIFLVILLLMIFYHLF